MADTAFVPTIFTKHGCPFCLKLRLFLLEAGLLDTVSLVEGDTTEAHQKLAEQLSDHLEKLSFPAAEVTPGRYLAGSDDLVEHFARIAGCTASELPTYQAYASGVFPSFQKIYRELMEMKKPAA